MTEQLNTEQITSIITMARKLGLAGSGPDCGDAAVAINRVLFDGRGTLIAGVNTAFLDRGRFIGHIAVLVDYVFWDVEGRPKTNQELERWAKLDLQNSDHTEAAEALGFVLDAETATTTKLISFAGEREALAQYDTGHLDRFVHALTLAKTLDMN